MMCPCVLRRRGGDYDAGCRTGIYDTKTNIGASSSKPTSILFQNKEVRPQWGHSIASPPPPKLRSPEKSRACVGSMRVALWHGCA